MKRLASYTQTYNSGGMWSPGTDGADRMFLFNAFLKDKNKIQCIKELDFATFSFHDLSVDKSKEIANALKHVLPNAKFMIYQNMTFSTSIKKHLEFLKSLGATDFVWIQDDEFFTYTNYDDFYDVLNYYKNNESIKHLNLLYSLNDDILRSQYSEHTGIKYTRQFRVNKDIFISETSAKNITSSGAYEMDFTCFMCNIDYFLENIYDESFVKIFNAYELEAAIKNKAAANNIQRCFTNVSFFESFNIVGLPPSLGNKDKAKTKLVELYS